jgi:hypothetical protein
VPDWGGQVLVRKGFGEPRGFAGSPVDDPEKTGQVLVRTSRDEIVNLFSRQDRLCQEV